VGLNRPIDIAAATELASTFIEAVIAPGIDAAAAEILAAKANLRVVTADFARARELHDGGEMRTFLGGLLSQEPDRVDEAADRWPNGGSPQVVTKRAPTGEEWEALRFAWRVCAHVKSNAVIFTGRDRTIAIGAGQMSRVDAVNVAIAKVARDFGPGDAATVGRDFSPGDSPLTGSVAASDAFFPFRDGLDALAAAGATAIVQPGGSKRDAEVIAAADDHGIAMVFTGRRHFRH
jgi:phosphoribosylaminoimidazolecarboxamide formyltransferase/IMP cyclohydrolase